MYTVQFTTHMDKIFEWIGDCEANIRIKDEEYP